MQNLRLFSLMEIPNYYIDEAINPRKSCFVTKHVSLPILPQIIGGIKTLTYF